MLAVPATRAAEGLDRRAFTVADVVRMLEAGVLDADEKFELIGGEIVPMSPQLMPHAVVKSRIARWLTGLNLPGLEVATEMSVQARTSELLEPDVVVFTAGPLRREFLPIDRLRMAVEVADTSLDRDLRKAAIYGAAGLPELWIVDLTDRRTLVFQTLAGVWTELPPTPFDGPLRPLCAPDAALLLAPLAQ